jgi:hypothetical protein
MSLKLNSSGGGSVTLQEPSTASNLTMTLPTTTGTAVIQDASNNLLMNSGYGSDAVAYGCRAWVNFNGTGTVAIRASGNVSSITDNGTGDYTINFSTALADANYCPVGMGIDVSGAQVIVRRGSAAQTTSACRVSSEQPGTSSADCSQVNVAIFR